MGRGWRHSWESCLLISRDKVILVHEDGREESFDKLDENTYRSNQAGVPELKKIEDIYGYRRQDGLVCLYNGEGQMFRVMNDEKIGITIVYENKKMVKVQADTGENLVFAYNERELLAEVVDHTNRKIRFTYDKNKLTGVTDPLGNTIHYDYGKSGRIEQIMDKRGVAVLKNSYDEHRRITAQEFPDGGVIKFRYLDGKNRIFVTEQNGNEITYIRDDQFRNIRTDYEDGSELYSYDENNRCTSYTDKRRNTTTYSYDENGCLIAVTDALKNRRTASYDQNGRLMMQTEADGGNTYYRYDRRGRLAAITDTLGNTLRFIYDGRGRRPVRLCFPDGGEMRLAYDQKGNIASIISPEGDEEVYEYDSLGRVVQSSDGNGNKVKYRYDEMDRLMEVIRQDGKKRIYKYNEMGEAVQIVDFDGYSMQWEYNVLNKPKCYTDKEGRNTFMEYDLTWKLSRVVDPEGGVTEYTYDHLKRLTAIADSVGSRVCFTYDANGNQTSIRYPDESAVYFEYDALNRKVSETDERGGVTRTVYDSMGRITRVVDPEGGETSYEYDRAGNKILEKDASGAVTTYEYTSLGKPKTITYPSGRVEKYHYQPGGRLLKKEYGDGTWEEYDYDHAGNVLSIDRQDGTRTTYDYDCLNRVVQIKQNGEMEKRYTYDALGNVSVMEDAGGNQMHYRYSPEGNLTGVTDPEGNRVIYTYNGRNELMGILQLTAEDVIKYIQMTPARQEQIPDSELWEVIMLNKQNNPLHITLFERNRSGQIETVTDGLGQKESYRYDAMGRVISRTDREGGASTFCYYPGGELKEAAYPDGKRVLLSYDALNRLSRIRDWLGETVFDYDEAGRITKTVDYKGDTFRYGWNPDGSRNWMEYPDGAQVHYTYDDKARLTQIVCGDFRIHYNYDENSRIRECHRGNGVISQLRYNRAGQVKEILHTKGAELLEHLVYSFDNLGNPVRVKRESMDVNCSYTHEFAYDKNNRLTTILSSGRLLRQYQYDGYGNRISIAETAKNEQRNCSVTAYRYDPLNQLAGMGAEEYTHTLNGGRRYGSGRDGQTYCYEYDSLGHLKGICHKEECLQENEYNGLGHRVIAKDKTNSAYNTTISYNIDYTNEYARICAEKGRQERKYLWQGNDLCGMPGEESYVLTDALHTPICVTDREGIPHNAYCYNEFGVLEYKKEEIPLPFGFTGFPREHIENLYYAGAREYDSIAGNFLTRDLLYYIDFENPNTLNLYQYVQGNPLRYLDYSGHACIEERDYYAKILKMHFMENVVKQEGGRDREISQYMREILHCDCSFEGEENFKNPIINMNYRMFSRLKMKRDDLQKMFLSQNMVKCIQTINLCSKVSDKDNLLNTGVQIGAKASKVDEQNEVVLKGRRLSGENASENILTSAIQTVLFVRYGIEDMEYARGLLDKGFPFGYVVQLMPLHEKYPEWQFEPVITEVDYQEFLEHEIASEVKCSGIDAYSTDKIFEPEDDYFVANEDAIRYFTHPYSMLMTDQGKYENALQFLVLDQDLPKEYTDGLVEQILFDKDKEVVEAIKNSNGCIHPVFLAAIYSIENGPAGKEVNGQKVYNLFNIGANSGGEDARAHAVDGGWDTPQACIEGSMATFEEYMENGQNTLYAFDWDYVSYEETGKACHQYAAMVNSAEDKAMSLAIRDNVEFDLHHEFVFSIPVYENVPSSSDEGYAGYRDPHKIARENAQKNANESSSGGQP